MANTGEVGASSFAHPDGSDRMSAVRAVIPSVGSDRRSPTGRPTARVSWTSSASWSHRDPVDITHVVAVVLPDDGVSPDCR